MATPCRSKELGDPHCVMSASTQPSSAGGPRPRNATPAPGRRCGAADRPPPTRLCPRWSGAPRRHLVDTSGFGRPDVTADRLSVDRRQPLDGTQTLHSGTRTRYGSEPASRARLVDPELEVADVAKKQMRPATPRQ